tara:strand:- start:1230 stop:1439 length:210 start_codon:yes stop_codon:yes gene_type:complete
MPHKCSSEGEQLTPQERLAEFWSRPAVYVPPKVFVRKTEDIDAEEYIASICKLENINGGRQVPNRKPKY